MLKTLFSSLIFMSSLCCMAETVIHKNDTTGLLIYSAEKDGFKIELIQLIPDFVSAVYVKHNFPQAELDRINSYCVFGTIIENKSQTNLQYDVAQWRYKSTDGEIQAVKTKDQWIKEWREQGINFNWTMLPASGNFAEGDWQQGFTTIKTDRDKAFDFIYHWQIDGQSFSNTIHDIRCAPLTLEPEE